VVVPRSYIALEPRVRRLIAAHLGVDPGSLHADTDLRLGTGALRSVARALERSFSVALEEPELARLKSCRELSMLVARRVAERDWPAHATPASVWVRVIPTDPGCPLLERLVELTPYMVETIVEDARGRGRTRRLEVIVGPGQPPQSATQVEHLLTAARAAGLSVHVCGGTSARAAPGPVRRRKPAS
jgi:hypothetical protein